MTPQRFFFGQDDDGHWYLVPADKRAEWDAWRDLPSDDERSWEEPEFANMLGGGVGMYTFSDPQGN